MVFTSDLLPTKSEGASMLRPTFVLLTNRFSGNFLVVLENLFNFAKSTNLSKKKMKTKLLVFFILLIACLPKGIQANNSIQQYHAKQDTASMKKYQTFDEFTMRGIGTAKASPFVYVKEMGDSIYVVSSCPKDSARLYVKINNDLWYNHMEYHMWKKDSVAYKSL